MLTERDCDELRQIVSGLEFFQDVLLRISLNADFPAYLRAARTELGNGQAYIKDELESWKKQEVRNEVDN